MNSGLFTGREKSRLERLVRQGETIAVEALNRWLRVLRWQSLRPHIGRPEIAHDAVHGVYLVDLDTRNRFYAGPIELSASVSTPLSKLTWRRTEAALLQGLEPPIWVDFLLEGEHRLAFGDLTGSVVHLAISAESLLRALVARRHAKAPPHDEFLSFLNQVSVSRIVDRWKPLGFRGRGWGKAMDIARFKRLFELRNRLMHRGDATLDPGEVRGLANVVRILVQSAG